MRGHLIGTSISVNFAYSTKKSCIYFLTHIDNNISKQILPDYVDYLHTSELNVWILVNHFKVDPQRLVIIPTDRQFSYKNEEIGIEFMVKAVEVLEKPGTLIFYFQGNEFGNVLYIGSGCSTSVLFYQENLYILSEKELDTVYVDTAALRRNNSIPNMPTIALNVTSFLKCHQAHRILIIVEDVFFVSILCEIRSYLKENIYVNTGTFELLKIIEKSEGFTTDYLNARIYAISLDEIQDFMQYGNKQNELPRISILLTSTLKSVFDKNLELTEMHIYIYRNYISTKELKLLLEKLKAKYVVPLEESDLALLQEFLDTKLLHHRSKILHVANNQNTEYWNRFDNLEKFFQHKTFHSSHTEKHKSKANKTKIKLLEESGTHSANIERNDNSVKLKRCSVRLEKFTSEEIKKYCYTNISPPRINCQIQENPSEPWNIELSKCNKILKSRNLDKSVNVVEIQSHKLTHKNHNHNGSFSRSNLRKEIGDVQQVNFLKEIGLIPKIKLQNNKQKVLKN